MPSAGVGLVLRHIRRLTVAQTVGTLSDRQLLQRFARQHDEAAFTALVERHGPLVFGVCLRVLRDHHDAEDAFQATFLVLARRARSVRWQDSIANWLHAVALRIAIKKRCRQCRGAMVMRADGSCEEPVDHRPQSDPAMEAARRDLYQVLDDELNRLPGKYRSPLVLCYLEGKTNEEAARELGRPPGSMSRHLTRARELLRERLSLRGFALPATLLAAVVTERSLSAAVPASLSDSTIRAAMAFAGRSALLAGSASAEAVALAEGMLQAMTLTKLKVALAVVLTLGIVGIGTGGVLQAPETKKETAAAAPAGPADKAKKDTPAQNPVVEDDPDRLNLLAMRVQGIRDKLDKPITLDKGIDPQTQFKDAMEFLSDRYDISIIVNNQAFHEAADVDNVEELPVRLPKMVGVSLDTVLKMLMSQVQGAYLIHRDYIEVVPRKRAWPQEWTPDARHIVPAVTANFRERPLHQALQDVADRTGISVILDERVTSSARSVKVTARFDQTPLDTAVALLADMGDLKSVAVDNVLYVTKSANAVAIRAERQPPGSPPKHEKSKAEPADKPQEKASKPPGK